MSGYFKIGEKTLGRLAYEAYAERFGDGATWDDLPVKEQTAWSAAGTAVAKSVYAAVDAAEPCPETQPAPKGYPCA